MKRKSIFGIFWPSTATIALLLLAGCVTTQVDPGKDAEALPAAVSIRAGYTCCNLHYDGDRIIDSNPSQLPFLPLGTPIRIKRIEGYVAHADVGGRPMQLALESGRTPENFRLWLERIVVGDNPQIKLSGFPSTVREAITAGQVTKGMNREQVVMAIGYPQTSDKIRMDGPHWRYWWSAYLPYYVYWSGNKLTRVEGPAEAVGTVFSRAR